MKQTILFTLLGIFISGLCIAQETIYEDLSCIETHELIQLHIDDPNFVIIDFRPEEKYNKIHLENAIYVDVLSDTIDNYLENLNKEKTYLIYCTIGRRSSVALKKMKKLKFKNVYHLYEGIKEWDEQGFDVISAQK